MLHNLFIIIIIMGTICCEPKEKQFQQTAFDESVELNKEKHESGRRNKRKPDTTIKIFDNCIEQNNNRRKSIIELKSPNGVLIINENNDNEDIIKLSGK